MTILNSKKENITSKLSDYDIEYNPKIGLIFKKVKKSDIYEIGTLTCQGTMGGKTSLAKFNFRFPPQIRLTEPTITSDTIYPLQNGKSAFKCAGNGFNLEKGADFDVGKIFLFVLKSKC